MHKPIGEMAAYLQNLLPQEIPQTFAINPVFLGDITKADIHKGVPAFKDFMQILYAHLIAGGSPFDKPKRESHNTNINSSYPFILHLAMFLMNIGMHGKLNENKDALAVDGLEALTAAKYMSYQKIPEKRANECLRFLSCCGLFFGGLDISGNKPELASTGLRGPIVVTNPDNPAMLAGLKAMSAAQHNIGSKYLGEIILRCDWRALSYGERGEVNPVDIMPILKDLTHTLPAGMQAYILQLHADHINRGYKCIPYVGTNTRFEYFCRSKELWRFNLTVNNGHVITIKAQNTAKYPEIVAQLPKRLQTDIAKGYGCGKKMGITDSCNDGCRGYRVPLDNSFMGISDVVKTWLEWEADHQTKRYP